MLACFRQGYVVLPCTEQLRAKDLELRLQVAEPRLIVADAATRHLRTPAGPARRCGCRSMTQPRTPPARGARPRIRA